MTIATNRQTLVNAQSARVVNLGTQGTTVRVKQAYGAFSVIATGRGKVVDYRHLLPALKRKPGALARSALRDDLFPRTEYRQMWAQLKDQLPEAAACRLMVGLLDLAGNGGCEAALAQRLALLLVSAEVPDLEQLKQDLAPRPALYPVVTVTLPDLASYDQLLEAA